MVRLRRLRRRRLLPTSMDLLKLARFSRGPARFEDRRLGLRTLDDRNGGRRGRLDTAAAAAGAVAARTKCSLNPAPLPHDHCASSYLVSSSPGQLSPAKVKRHLSRGLLQGCSELPRIADDLVNGFDSHPSCHDIVVEASANVRRVFFLKKSTPVDPSHVQFRLFSLALARRRPQLQTQGFEARGAFGELKAHGEALRIASHVNLDGRLSQFLLHCLDSADIVDSIDPIRRHDRGIGVRLVPRGQETALEQPPHHDHLRALVAILLHAAALAREGCGLARVREAVLVVVTSLHQVRDPTQETLVLHLRDRRHDRLLQRPMHRQVGHWRWGLDLVGLINKSNGPQAVLVLFRRTWAELDASVRLDRTDVTGGEEAPSLWVGFAVPEEPALCPVGDRHRQQPDQLARHQREAPAICAAEVHSGGVEVVERRDHKLRADASRGVLNSSTLVFGLLSWFRHDLTLDLRVVVWEEAFPCWPCDGVAIRPPCRDLHGRGEDLDPLLFLEWEWLEGRECPRDAAGVERPHCNNLSDLLFRLILTRIMLRSNHLPGRFLGVVLGEKTSHTGPPVHLAVGPPGGQVTVEPLQQDLLPLG
mmetsp:Transcript_115679/g.367825  ORF Transcript_115679/g.367825 Transcript_115679/m.367825 type:complete len:590 (+) Transcript_115679:1889-3658(+)